MALRVPPYGRTHTRIQKYTWLPYHASGTHTHTHTMQMQANSTTLRASAEPRAEGREVPTPVRRLGPLSHHAGLAHEPRQTHPEAEHLPATQEAALTAAAAGRGRRCNLMARAG